MNKKVKIKGALRFYFLWPVALTVLLLCMNLWIYLIDKNAGYLMTAFVLVYFLSSVGQYYIKRYKIEAELINFAMGFTQVQKKLLKELTLPYAILDKDGRIQWANDEFMNIVNMAKVTNKFIYNLFPEITTDAFPGAEIDENKHIVYDNRFYNVVLRKTLLSEFDNDNNFVVEDNDRGWAEKNNSLISIYLYDETEITTVRKENKDQKLVVGLLYIDNYDETLDNVDEVKRSLLSALVERKINKSMQNIDAIVKKLEKDKYVFVCQFKYLSVLQSNRFSLLEEVRTINIGNDMSVTISMGLGVNANTYLDAFEYARAAMDLALGRGGDQAVVKDREKFLYYGGKTVQIEKSTRVKARVRAHALKEFIEGKDKVVIMGHKIGDIDSFGSAIGLYRIAKTLNKRAHIVINEVTSSLKPMMDRFIFSSEYEDDMFLKGEKAKEIVDDNTLLIIVDVNRPSYTECEELLDLTNTIVVLDHHRQTGESINKAVLSYIEPYASSTCEMVAEILLYIGEGLKLRPIEADALYAGIMIDTNNFLTKTGVRTFEAAAYLRRSGADISRIRKLFRTEMIDFKIKADAISSTEIFHEFFAIAICEGKGVDSPTILGAQVANELLNINNIKATFVFTPFNEKIYISARSIDEINVQLIMEKLGGGGHLSVAGAQFDNITIEEAINELKEIVMQMISDGEILKI